MNKTPSIARRLIVATGCLAVGAAFADCTSRKPRAAETAFNSRAVAALHAALPPLPAGVEQVGGRAHDFKTTAEVQEILCDFSKEGDFSVWAKRTYLRKHSEAERRRTEAQYDHATAQFHALKKTPADKAVEQQALRQRSNAAWQATRDAEKAGDKAAAQVHDAEYRSLRNQADAIDARHVASVKPQLDELHQRRTAIDLASQRVEIVLGINLQRLPATPAGDTGGAWGAASPGKSAELKVHNLVFSVNGTEGPLRQALAAAVDRAYLQSLLGKPLPSEAQSEALAARATPAMVAEIAAAAGSESADATGSQATAAPAPGPARTAAIAAAPPAAQAAAPSPPPPPADSAAAAEPVKKAAEALNKLRGLLGR